jgi:hypothetical protein
MGIAISTFILIDTLTFPVALVVPGLVFAKTLHRNRVLDFVTIRVSFARLWQG